MYEFHLSYWTMLFIYFKINSLKPISFQRVMHLIKQFFYNCLNLLLAQEEFFGLLVLINYYIRRYKRKCKYIHILYLPLIIDINYKYHSHIY